uniref:YveK family protein n=1 Tax=Eubacterium cellulosolvens TaxID=29322 RepID=UPI0009DDC7A7|nr:Wzz/FepE/Etk N-terminal domain-containing protein [[Eubacterium] cellulosolvens]
MEDRAEVIRNLNMQDDGGEMELDLVELLYAIRRKIWYVLLIALIGASIAAGITKFVMTPMYTSSSMMIVLTKETTIASIADLQMGSQLTNDYKVLILSRPVLEETIKKTGLDLDYKELKKYLTITNEKDTRILQLSVEQPNPQLAKKVVDTLAGVASAYIADKMEVQAPKIVEVGEVPIRATSPSMAKNVVIGFLLGALLMIAIITVQVMLNDTVVSDEDVDKYLQLTTLASIPLKTAEDRKAKQKINANKRKGRCA